MHETNKVVQGKNVDKVNILPNSRNIAINVLVETNEATVEVAETNVKEGFEKLATIASSSLPIAG